MLEMDRSRELLLAALDALKRKSNKEWMSSLSGRKLEELEFHDKARRPRDGRAEAGGDRTLGANRKYYSTVGLSTEYRNRWIDENTRGKVFLDYACGNGGNAIRAAKAGADLAVGIDLSRVSVENARRNAAAAGVSDRTVFVQDDCENTGFPGNSIDRVICSGMLHHLDLDRAFTELDRIMKPGAVLLGVEALNYNPVIKLYRKLTPRLRTEWEKAHILSLKDLAFAGKRFRVRNVRYWHLFSVLAAFLRNTPAFGSTLKLANAVDSRLLRIPFVCRLAWMFTFELVKPDSPVPPGS